MTYKETAEKIIGAELGSERFNVSHLVAALESAGVLKEDEPATDPNEQAPWRLHPNHVIEAQAQDRAKRAIFTSPIDVRYGFIEGYDFACSAITTKPEPDDEEIQSRFRDWISTPTLHSTHSAFRAGYVAGQEAGE